MKFVISYKFFDVYLLSCVFMMFPGRKKKNNGSGFERLNVTKT
jgi:hypothetical protein